jgi:curved DNA-binding protein
VEFKDYYQMLGVARDASPEAIKKAYRQLARKYHPDVSKEPDAAARMSEVNEAYAVLSDPERKAAYDNVGQGHQGGEHFTPPPGWDSGYEFSGSGFEQMDPGEFSEFFSQLFGRAGAARHHARRPAGGGRGEDRHARIELALEDAFTGGLRHLTLQHPEVDAQGRVQMRSRVLEVQIPRGVRPGQFIRLAGQGGPGQPPGDLLLEVSFRPHPLFHVENGVLVGRLPVAPWEAALGAVVPVALPDGHTLKVRVPAGAQAGRRLTVRGRGLPSATPGDLELVVQVVLPSGLDPRARALYEQMARELTDFDARKVAAAEAERGETPT